MLNNTSFYSTYLVKLAQSYFLAKSEFFLSLFESIIVSSSHYVGGF